MNIKDKSRKTRAPLDSAPEVLTAEEAATYLRIDKHTLYTLIKTGKIKPAKIGGNYRFHRSYLEKLVGAPKRNRT